MRALALLAALLTIAASPAPECTMVWDNVKGMITLCDEGALNDPPWPQQNSPPAGSVLTTAPPSRTMLIECENGVNIAVEKNYWPTTDPCSHPWATYK